MKSRMTYSQFADELPIGRTKFYALKAEGVFPAGIVAEGKTTVFWLESEIRQWLSAYDSGLSKSELREVSRQILVIREKKLAADRAAFKATFSNVVKKYD